MSSHPQAHLGPYLWIPDNPENYQQDICAEHLGAEEPRFCPVCGVKREHRYQTRENTSPGRVAAEEARHRLTVAAEGEGFVTLISNIMYKEDRNMIDCQNYTRTESEIEIGPGDREMEGKAFRRMFPDEIAAISKAEPHAEVRWGLLFWYM